MTAPEVAPRDAQAPGREAGWPRRLVVFIGTVLVIIAVAVLPLLTPLFIHPALDAAGAAGRVGLDTTLAHEMSDRSVQDLVLWSGDFAFEGPDGSAFYDADERGHLRDARILLWLFLGAGAISAIVIGITLRRSDGPGRATAWRVISRAGAATAIVVVVLGVISAVAFGTLFTLFHQIFFPAGNWSFDPATQRLVQLYPFRFWQIAAAALGLMVAILGIAAWLLGRSMSRSRSPDPRAGQTPGSGHG